mmetsp:Transcript_122841/g.358519  ORF Transcript_122841/g.358519 Transcript_122841/m.358519 type:complete len:303 (+) Transcript_122841:165-1073(+)
MFLRARKSGSMNQPLKRFSPHMQVAKRMASPSLVMATLTSSCARKPYGHSISKNSSKSRVPLPSLSYFSRSSFIMSSSARPLSTSSVYGTRPLPSLSRSRKFSRSSLRRRRGSRGGGSTAARASFLRSKSASMARTSSSDACSQSSRMRSERSTWCSPVLPTRYLTHRMPRILSAFFFAKKSKNSEKSIVPLSSSSNSIHCSTKVSISASVPRCSSKMRCLSWMSQSSFPTCPKRSTRRLSQASRCCRCVSWGDASAERSARGAAEEARFEECLDRGLLDGESPALRPRPASPPSPSSRGLP